VKVPNATLTVTWPYALKDASDGDLGKHVLYLMHEPILVSKITDNFRVKSRTVLNLGRK